MLLSGVALASHGGNYVNCSGEGLCYGSDQKDDLHGNQFFNNINAQDGNDFMFGKDAPDSLDGQNKSDYAEGDGDGDVIDGNDGSEFWDCGSFFCGLRGFNGDDTIVGGPSDDVIAGGEGNDIMRGEGGEDWIYADDGNADVVNGGDGSGHDHCWIDQGKDESHHCHEH